MTDNSRYSGPMGGPNFGPIRPVQPEDLPPHFPKRPQLPAMPMNDLSGAMPQIEPLPGVGSAPAAQAGCWPPPGFASKRPARGPEFGDPPIVPKGGSMPSFGWIGRDDSPLGDREE